MFAFVLGLSFVLLTVAFRSIVIPAVAIALNLLSVGAAYGLLVLVFQKGVGNELLGFQQIDTIEAWVPLFLFSVLFGLSMDYQVFLLSRIKERYTQTGDTAGAVAFGVGSTARLITGAALIIIAVFGGFAAGDLVMFQQMGFGVAVALLVDATIVRCVLVPASMKLLGERNWYLPSWLELGPGGPRRRARSHRVRSQANAGARPARASAHHRRQHASRLGKRKGSHGFHVAHHIHCGQPSATPLGMAARRPHRLPDRRRNRQPGRRPGGLCRHGTRRRSGRGRRDRSRAVARTTAGRSLALDPSHERRNGGRSHRRLSACRLRDRSRSLIVMGAVTGALVGGSQALVLARSGISGSAWWAIANAPAWALGWLVTSYVITKNVDEQFTNFGASGTLLFAILTSLLLALLFRRSESGPEHDVSIDRVAAALLIGLPIAFNAFFFALARLFDYPSVLRSPVGMVLSRFLAGGLRLKLVWYGFMLTAVLFAPLAVLLGQVLSRDDLQIVPVTTTIGVLAAVVQFLGLARWPFLVPALARAHESPDSSPATREATAVVFDSFNRYLGVAVGECLGYLFTGSWTVLAGIAMLRSSVFEAWLAWPGIAIGALLVLGSFEFVGRFEEQGWKLAGTVVPIAYTAWSVWLIITGVVLLGRPW